MPSPIEQYQQWRKKPFVGCMFARNLAIAPPRWGQYFKVVPNGSSPTKIAENLAKSVDLLVADKTATGAALILPTLVTLEETAKVMLALNALPKWQVTPSKLENEVVGEMIALRVARQIPFGNGECESEALVLGNFPEFPPTRRSPVTALEIFVGEPLSHDPKTGNPTVKANLAHIIEKGKYPGHYDGVWAKSEAGRLEQLGGKPDNRAKAKVSLVVPTVLAKKLGCVP